MMRLDKDENVPRKTCVVFFVIDTSDSMSGTKIGAVNSAIEETLEQFRIMNLDNDDAEIEVAILAFSSGARWITPDCPVKPENYRIDLDAGGKRDMGKAFIMLEESLYKNSGFMQEASKSYAPVIILITDGEPTDDYKTHLTKLQNNRLFKAAIKIALPIGDKANEQILMEFTGSKEAVVRVRDGGNIMKMIKFVAVTDEQVCDDCEYDENTNLSQVDSDWYEAPSSDDWDDISCDYMQSETLQPRKCLFFYIIGFSNSMTGQKIGADKSAIEQALENELNTANTNTVIEVIIEDKWFAVHHATHIERAIDSINTISNVENLVGDWDDWDDWDDDSLSNTSKDNIPKQTKSGIKTGQIELFVQPRELDKINSAKKNCLLARDERFTLNTLYDDLFTVYSLSDRYIFGYIFEEKLGNKRFTVLQKQNDKYTEVNGIALEKDIASLSTMYFGEGEVKIKDVHWGADVFLHITAYNIVHEKYYMLNFRVGFGDDERFLLETSNNDNDWDDGW